MSKYVLGGNRVGSGGKMKGYMHEYNRSTHNLSERWASSMASGILYPAMCKIATRGDSFDIDIAADLRTIPTLTPLFGSYKMQIDVYQAPIRLYQAILHNNPLAIGLNMGQVKFPRLEIADAKSREDSGRMSNSCLLKYLGLSGLGKQTSANAQEVKRQINALPALAYYDIFKTYYANKQEEKAYVISAGTYTENVGTSETGSIKVYNELNQVATIGYDDDYVESLQPRISMTFTMPFDNLNEWWNAANTDAVIMQVTNDDDGHIAYITNWDIRMAELNGSQKIWYEQQALETEQKFLGIIEVKKGENEIILKVSPKIIIATEFEFTPKSNNYSVTRKEALRLQKFDLTNIDDMRYDLLSQHTLGQSFVINTSNAYLPYKALVDKNSEGATLNSFALNGLVIKTYQNDIFNNWLNSEWIEGENGINELSKVSVTDGAFSMDALSFAQKLYNMLNRIAVAGATYEDWQDAVYETVKRRQIESPIFLGGMSQEVMFDEIIQTAPGDGDPDGTGTLGTMGGRGSLQHKKKGGKIHVKCDEACFIIAIVSLTPRVFYTQGNEFYMTELESMDDLHKPALDGIGFQDLIGERMAWWDTKFNGDNISHRSKIGKLPAWIEYMTSVDKAYGDFALEYGKSSYTLNRNYEVSDTGGIKDATTYVDPSKYNYAFAYTALESQNFWVMINFEIKARRLMSARLIPNV